MLSTLEIQMILLAVAVLSVVFCTQDLGNKLPWKQPTVDDDGADRQEKRDNP